MNKTNIGLRRGSITKILHWSTMIGCLTLNLKEGMEMVLIFRDLGVLLVESNIWASVFQIRMDALDVGVRVIR